MKQGMDMIVNRLPARTWNWLKMNESSLSGIGIDNLCPAVQNRNSGAVFSAAKKDASRFEQTPEWTMETALGEDMDKLLETGKLGEAGDAGAVGESSPADSLFAKAGSGKSEDALSVLTYTFEAGKRSMSRLYLHAEKDSVLRVAILCKAEGAGASETAENRQNSLAALQVKVRAEEGAKVYIYLAQLLDEAFTALCDIGGVAENTASVQLLRMELGAGKLYAGAAVDLAGKSSAFEAHIGYAAKPGQHLDMNYTARHRGKKTQSLMTASGVLSEDSFKIFRGTIDLQNGCQGAKGTESEDVLLLGDHVVNQTIPLILCSEEDVEGNHGASIGRLDDNMLFYLNTRGIPTDEAERLIARAKLDAVCGMIPDKEIRDEIQQFMGGGEEDA